MQKKMTLLLPLPLYCTCTPTVRTVAEITIPLYLGGLHVQSYLYVFVQNAVTVEVVDDSITVPPGLTVLGYDVTVSGFIPVHTWISLCIHVHVYIRFNVHTRQCTIPTLTDAHIVQYICIYVFLH